MKVNTLYTIIAILLVLTGCGDETSNPTAEVLYVKGRELYTQGEYVESLNMFSQSREAAHTEKNDTTLMKAMLAIGNIHTIFDDYEQAVRHYQACYTKAIETGDGKMRQSSLNNMLICYSLLGNSNEAIACYRQLQDSPSRGKVMDGFFSYVNQGLVAQAQKSMKMASHYFNCALEHAQQNNMGEAYVCSLYGMLGRVEYEGGEYQKAEAHYLKCLEAARKDGPSTVLCSVYEKLTQLYRTMGNESKELYYHHLNIELTDSVFNRQRLYDKQGEILDKERQRTDEELLMLNNTISQQWLIICVIGTSLIILIALVVVIFRQNRSLVSAQRLLVSKHREHLHREQVEKELRDEYLSAVNKTAKAESGGDSSSAPLLGVQQTELLLAEIARVMGDISVISDPDFNLQQLASLVGSNTKYVSWVINSTYNKNFKTYLNDYRIEEASKLLVDKEYCNLTLRAISLQVGFKSTTSFNTAFKRVIGMTPSAYQRLYAEEHSEEQED